MWPSFRDEHEFNAHLVCRMCCMASASSLFADERDRVQKKTFTKWVNKHLMKVRKHINDLYEDLRDGHNLISLLEVLSGIKLGNLEKLQPPVQCLHQEALCVLQGGEWGMGSVSPREQPREKGRMRFHRLQNVQIALDFLKQRQVKLVNIRNDDITDGNPKLTLGLIWTIILHFQVGSAKFGVTVAWFVLGLDIVLPSMVAPSLLRCTLQ
ncbi:Microtubule-actin cross-linking factor 1, isoforms 1/2/3/5 [Galemys pyrenaicus]|uniref:Microtubule-actin cross-linking factor 1, isoforms 1/2/3/5 n=1 Tax=Galemys pyrenaicus TaxID=202257 RepID=A0A8J5ZUW0_GALPY|nr:Microtubule-actin cross-linking factor 1, isoforms 1/2/3/5 [Galemys pyrenaicus]